MVAEELRGVAAERIRLVIQEPLSMVAAVSQSARASVAAGNLVARVTHATLAQAALAQPVVRAEMLARKRICVVMESTKVGAAAKRAAVMST